MKNETPQNQDTTSNEVPSTPVESADTTPMTETEPTVGAAKQNPFSRFGRWYWRHKKWTILLTILLLLAVALAVPFTRYPMINWFWKQDVKFTLKDSRNNSPVSEASLTIAGHTVKTDKNGVAALNDVPVGPQKIEVSKKYYKSYTSEVTVSEFGNNQQNVNVSLEATGRMVNVVVQNTITGKGVEDATIATSADNHAITDTDGSATIVVAADKGEVTATITTPGYNKQTVKLAVGDDSKKNTFTILPSGNVYFLSKQSGKIDVVKTNLDGSNRKVVYAGTGREDNYTTTLLASRDWKYMALKSKRDAAKNPSLYLINAADDTVVPVDEGNAEFTPVGWSGHRFIYRVDRSTPEWQPKHSALKSYDAETKQMVTLDETAAEGNTQFDSRYEVFAGNPYILDGGIVYSKAWTKYYGAYSVNLSGKQSAIFSIKPDGTGKQTLKTVDPVQVESISATSYGPQEIYFGLFYRNGAPATYLELEDGVIKDAPKGSNPLERGYPTYLVSPNGKATFWADARDGKNALFTGDINGKNEKQIAASSDYTAYGWFTDNYVLVSKNQSELFIMSKDGLQNGKQPLKISDYHKPSLSFPGYGYGYGGI